MSCQIICVVDKMVKIIKFVIWVIFLSELVKAEELRNCSVWNAIYPSVGIRCEGGWLNYVNLLNDEFNQLKKVDVVFFGDSITEQLRGTRNGFVDCRWCDPKLTDFFQNFAKQKGWNVFISAISGDQTAQLLWRLENGQLQRDLKPVKLTFLLIGTNDLHSAAKNKSTAPEQLVDFVVNRIISIKELIKQSIVNSRVIVIGLLPRGNGTVEQFFDPSSLQPEDYIIPNVYSPYVRKINNKLHNKFGNDFLDCGSNFITKEGSLDKDLMLDTVHPTTAGWISFLNCIDEFLLQYTQQQQKEEL